MLDLSHGQKFLIHRFLDIYALVFKNTIRIELNTLVNKFQAIELEYPILQGL